MAKENEDFRNFVGRLLGMAGRALRRRLSHNLIQAGYDYQVEHMILLGYLQGHEGVNQQTLTEFMFRDKTATARWVDTLEAKNLVVRVPDKIDRRQKMVYLTSKGKALLKEFQQIARKTEQEALQGVDSQKIETCKEVLKEVRRNLER